jgi:hypothetical protein
VVPVTGTSAVNDGKGFRGLRSVTWPGSSVGVGTLRQFVSGDEGSNRKVAAILDMVAATTSAERTNHRPTYGAPPGWTRLTNDKSAELYRYSVMRSL